MTHTTTRSASAPLPHRYAASPTKTGPILVAVGGSDAASALRATQLLTLESGAAVLALAVLEPLPVYVAGTEFTIIPPDFEADRRAALLRNVAAEVERTVGPDPRWRVRLVYGDPARAIADVAREERAPLVVMGIGRRRPIDRLLGTETALRTIRRASCPVLAVTPELHAVPRTVVIATDFSAASASAAEAVLPLLAPGATVYLLHVWEPINIADPRVEAVNEGYRRALLERFERFTSALAVPPQVTVKHEVREGKPSARILDFAEAHGADLIVAGRHGLGVLERILVGSVTTSLLRRTPCSLLVAPEPPFTEADRLQRLLTGRSECRTPGDWPAQLDAFTRRNVGRRASLQLQDPVLGAEAQATGYAFLGATYDPRDERLELMFGDAAGGTRHLTRGIGDVRAVCVLTDAHGLDAGLEVEHRDSEGQTVLTFAAT